MKKQIALTFAVMIVLIAALGGIKFLQIRRAIAEHANFTLPPESVTTTKVRSLEWRDAYETIGSVSAVMGVTLSIETEGTIVNIAFESGSRVNKGDVLVELDRSVEEANLRAAVARADQARRNVIRAQTLKSQSAVSNANLEQAQSELRQADAEVQSLKAGIERKTIVAPFSGRTGIRMANLGEFLAVGTKVVPLFSTDPVFFDFTIPQRAISQVHPKSSIQITVDAYPGRVFVGEVTAVDPQVDPQTRNFRVQATVPNADDSLRPGMFGRVQVDLGTTSKVLVIPQSSVTYAPYGDSVYVVQEPGSATTEASKDSKPEDEAPPVRQQIVKLGEKRGDLVAITDGLKEGEEIVSAGAFKLMPDGRVNIDNSVQPTAAEHPSVQDS
jgi:membrane fusion protein (multidrug efflux system)